MAITLTEKAAGEVKRIVAEQQTTGAAPEKVYLRMRVVGGGCSGFQHKLDLDPTMNPKLDEIFELFPNLQERLSSQGTKLSGGEQQMLAIGRILRTGARLLLLDEPTEGLAPVIIEQIGRTIGTLKQQGFTILLVEQNFRFASTVADRYYVMENGRIINRFANAELEANLDKLHDYLGV